MKKRFKGFYIIISSLVISALHLPFVFARSASPKLMLQPVNNKTIPVDSNYAFPTLKSAYDSLHLQLTGLSRDAYNYAKKGFDKLVAQGKILNSSILSIADFSQPSSSKRLYIIDLKNYKVLFNTWVAHGRNSGKESAESFSNDPSSFKSAPGFYVTKETYSGTHGYSLKLDGLEKGINDNAYERAIVVHGAAYVNPSLIATQGYIGRSLGCPAVAPALATPIINAIKDGTCFFIYEPGQAYVEQSAVLATVDTLS